MTNPEYLRARRLMRVTLVVSVVIEAVIVAVAAWGAEAGLWSDVLPTVAVVTGIAWIVTSWLVQRSRLPPKRI
jgi:hypothetical protein